MDRISERSSKVFDLPPLSHGIDDPAVLVRTTLDRRTRDKVIAIVVPMVIPRDTMSSSALTFILCPSAWNRRRTTAPRESRMQPERATRSLE